MLTCAIHSSLVTLVSSERHSAKTFNKKYIVKCPLLECEIVCGLIIQKAWLPFVFPKLHNQSCHATYSSEVELAGVQHISLKLLYLVNSGIQAKIWYPVKQLKQLQTAVTSLHFTKPKRNHCSTPFAKVSVSYFFLYLIRFQKHHPSSCWAAGSSS